MEVHPSRLGQARLWHHEGPGTLCLSVWTERVTDHGEDADPLVLFHRPSRRGLLAVFDGVGGAGRASAGRTPGHTERTQAWIASRRLRGLVEEWFVSGWSHDELRRHVSDRIGAGARVRTRMRGTISRAFPSTLAALDFHVLPDRTVAWDVLWAGDSRCYLATAEDGLQQLSRDDVAGTDALELLLADPPMTNMVCAEQDFWLNRWQGRTQPPCVLIAATDGFFGYVATPALFEHLLLDTLGAALDLRQWGELLVRRVDAYTGDDASLALVALGFSGLAELRSAFQHRATHLRVTNDELLRGVHGDRLATARAESWRGYQATYERRLAPVAVEEDR